VAYRWLIPLTTPASSNASSVQACAIIRRWFFASRSFVSAASLAHSRAHSQYSLVAPRIQLQELLSVPSRSWGLIGYQSKLQICNVVWSSQSRHCKRRGNDTRADEVVGLVVGTAGATSAAAELRRRPRFIILGTRRMRGVKPLRLGLFPSGDYSRAFQAGGLRWCQIQERIERGRP
jgi:hypothetical protein